MCVTSLPVFCLLLGQLTQGQPLPLEPIPRLNQPTLAEPQSAAPATPIDGSTSKVVQAGTETTLANDRVTRSQAAALLKRLATLKPGNGLQGKPLSLLTALQPVTDRNQQKAIIRIYWQVAVGAADHSGAMEDILLLNSIPAPRVESERAQLEAARLAAKARQHEARVALLAGQYDLLGMTRAVDSGELPLSADLPLVGSYRTQFEAMFRNRVAPLELKRIARTLPLLQTLLEARAKAVVGEEEAFTKLLQDYQNSEAKLAGQNSEAKLAGQNSEAKLAAILASHRQLRNQRIAFLATVRDYNLLIADYALSVAGPGVGARDVVSMLIPTTTSATAAASKSVLVPNRVAPTLRQVPATKLVPVQPAATPEKRAEPALPKSESPLPNTTLPKSVPSSSSLDDSNQFIPKKEFDLGK